MIETLTRTIAVLALVNSLGDAARLLGVGSGTTSPFEIFGITGFALMGAFAVARLFAAVGMWIRSTWGTPLLLGTTFIELALFLIATVQLNIGVVGFVARLIQLVGTTLILWTAFRVWRQGIHD